MNSVFYFSYARAFIYFFSCRNCSITFLQLNTNDIFQLLCQQSTEQVTAFCRSLHDMNPHERPMSSSSSSSSSSLSPSPVSALPPTAGSATQRQLSHADKLRKVIGELVETEKTYVKVSLNALEYFHMNETHALLYFSRRI